MLTTRYAGREIALTVLAGGTATAVAAYFLHAWALVPAVAALALLCFYRDPPRRAPAGDYIVLAPADGTVVAVEPSDAAGGAGPRPIRITIFLSVLNVHVNRSPCRGRVTEVTYRRGEFRNALRADANVRNESNTLTLAPRPPLPGPVQVRQIAGVLARRIVCAARVGDELAAGARFGMIKLGSRTELCLPADPGWELRVGVGDRVRAGRTIVARLRPQAAGGPVGAPRPDHREAAADAGPDRA